MSRTAAGDRDIETFTGHELAAYELSCRQVRDAALVICDRARDRDDARLLLEACGLTEYQRAEFQTYQYGRPKRLS